MKKNFILTLIIFIVQGLIPICIRAQEVNLDGLFDRYYNSGVDSDLVTYEIPLHSTTHFISKEPISYIDISTENVEGDLPKDNLARIRPTKGKMKEGDQFTITIVTAVAVTVYKLKCVDELTNSNATYVIQIYDHQGVRIKNKAYFKEQDFLSFAEEALGKKRRIFNLSTSAYDLTLSIRNIFSVHGQLLFEVQLKNHSKIPFDIDEVRFKIKDRKILNTTISQDVEIRSAFALKEDNKGSVQTNWTNVYAFKKFTYPQDKVFSIEFTERQISGRKISLNVDYNQILQADILKTIR